MMSTRTVMVALVSLWHTAFQGLCTFSKGLNLNKAEGASSAYGKFVYPVKDIGHLGESPEEFHARTRPAKYPRGDQAQVLSQQNNGPLPSGEPHEELHQHSSETRAESPAGEAYIDRPILNEPVASEPNLNKQRHLSGRTIEITNQLIVSADNEVFAPVENCPSQRALYPPRPSQIMYDHKEVLHYCYDWAKQYGYSVTTKSSTSGQNIAIWCIRHSEGCPWSMFWRFSRKKKDRGFYNVKERQGGPHNHSGGGLLEQATLGGPILALKVPTMDASPGNLPPRTSSIVFSITDGTNFTPTIHSKGSPGQPPPDTMASAKPPIFPEGSSSQIFAKTNNHNIKAKEKSLASGSHISQELPARQFNLQSMHPGVISRKDIGDPNNPVAISTFNGIEKTDVLKNHEKNFGRPSIILTPGSSRSSSEPTYNGNGWNLRNSLEHLTSRIEILPSHEQQHFIEEFMARSDWFEGGVSESSSLEDVTVRYKNRLPAWLSPFVKKIYDVRSDGHCGYRAVAAAVGYGATHGWCQVRNLLVKHVTINRGLYDGPYLKLLNKMLTRSPELSYEKDIINRIQWHFGNGDCRQYNHLKLPDFGYIISSAFKRPFYLYSELSDKGATFLPFFTNINKLPPISLFQTMQFHYLYLEISTEVFPIYPIDSMWHELKSDVALPWIHHLQNNLNLGYQLIPSGNM